MLGLLRRHFNLFLEATVFSWVPKNVRDMLCTFLCNVLGNAPPRPPPPPPSSGLLN